MNRALHPILRLGYRAQLAWWRVRRPSLQGAAVAVWHEGRVLVIRNSYRERPSFPAGGVGRREDHRSAAARELREEVGIHVHPDALDYMGEFLDVTDYADDYMHVYELRCSDAPSVKVDGREVVHAEFLRPADALEQGLAGVYRCYLRGVAADR